jgi:hypothetical protein
MSLDVYLSVVKPTEVYNANITHNLGKMAGKAGIYEHLWHPEEIGITKASQLIEPLRGGLEKLRANPQHFKQFNPANGWGDYEGLVGFIEDYIQACEENPDADISVDR